MRGPQGERACRDAGQTVRISVAVPSTAGFDRLVPAPKAICVARAGQKGDPDLKIAGNLANVSWSSQA
jgi:hypothetical protein